MTLSINLAASCRTTGPVVLLSSILALTVTTRLLLIRLISPMEPAKVTVATVDSGTVWPDGVGSSSSCRISTTFRSDSLSCRVMS
ncbi:MAG: hypothetical protein ACD_75C00343G0002 [uncultured bacterium]|nr:MAG: hypothetical protein ACD_75C00343G0002 [uncultured bacterium]